MMIVNNQHGVTLLENMVALLIISVGLLGFTGLQAFTLHGSASSAYRQTAIQLAQDMADHIRSNPAAFYNATNGVNNYQSATPSATPTAPTDCRTGRCTAIQLAAFNIYEWQVASNTVLPGNHDFVGGYISSVDLTDNAGTPIRVAGVGSPIRQRFTIAIRWDGDSTGSTLVGANPTDCSNVNPKYLKCYSLVIDL